MTNTLAGTPYQPSLMFANKAGAYSGGEHLKNTPALPANISQEWKGSVPIVRHFSGIGSCLQILD
jgi:hypothetical protein